MAPRVGEDALVAALAVRHQLTGALLPRPRPRAEAVRSVMTMLKRSTVLGGIAVLMPRPALPAWASASCTSAPPVPACVNYAFDTAAAAVERARASAARPEHTGSRRTRSR